MARVSSIEIKYIPAHYTLTMRRTIDFMKSYPAFAGEALEKAGACLRDAGSFPISGPIVLFHNTDLEALDVEMGWQIAEPVEADETMTCQPVPVRKIATTIDLGPYEAQDPTLMDLLGWVQKKGFVQQGPICYCYLNDTDRPEAEYLTQMMLPVE